jgi:hypothetical protein
MHGSNLQMRGTSGGKGGMGVVARLNVSRNVNFQTVIINRTSALGILKAAWNSRAKDTKK